MKNKIFQKSSLGVLFVVLLMGILFTFVGCKNGGRTGKEGEHGAKAPPLHEQKKELYQCPMHPTIISDHPDKCSVCGMDLQKVEEETVTEKTILYYRNPHRPEITSSTPAKDEMGMDYIPVYEEEVEERETSSVPGHASFTLALERQQLIGVKTTKAERRNLDVEIRTVGKVAFDPELYNTIVEYREALAAQERWKKSESPESAHFNKPAEALVRSAHLRLRLLGLSDSQIKKIGKGNNPDPINLLLPQGTVWVYGKIYEAELGLVKAGQVVVVTVPSIPGKTYTGVVAAIDPVLDPMSRSARVRAEISVPEEELLPEMFVHITIKIPIGEPIAIPVDAVLHAGEREIAFIRKEGGRFEPREVTIGRDAQGYYEILSGLAEGEEVVTSANFLIDSESRLRSALESLKHTH